MSSNPRFIRPFAHGILSLFLISCLLAVAVSSINAEVQLSGLELDPAASVEIKVISVFKQNPDAGFAPMQIFIRNNSGATRTWSFDFTASFTNTFTLSRELTVGNGHEQTFEVLVPLASNDTNYSRNNIQIAVRGYGVTRGFISHYGMNAGSSLPPTSFLLMSSDLSVHSWGPLEQALQKSNFTLHGSEFNPNVLPTDWRAYIGIESMWITDSEWMAMDAGPRDVIREWVAQGGRLTICSKIAHVADDYGFHDNRPGYGRVNTFVWDGRELGPAAVKPDVTPRDSHSLAQQLSIGYHGGWNLPEDIGILPLNGLFIIGFVFLFGAVVGPLNLFWFAKSGRRHRLFWTTPLISLAGSALLAAVIFFQDGLGGNGRRIISVLLIPGEKEAVVMQEQIARTGLLLSTHFTAGEKIYVAPIVNLSLRRKKREPGVHSSLEIRNHNYAVRDNFYSGDWFASRSVQAQIVEEIRPTRARVELVNSGSGGPPVLLSSVENTLDHVIYVDADGKYWQSAQLRLGERKTMEPAGSAEFKQWWTSNTHAAGGRMLDLIDQTKGKRNYFYAVADAAKDEAVATLPSIRWSGQKVIYFGECPEEKEAVTP